jgi:hypothetical protein
MPHKSAAALDMHSAGLAQQRKRKWLLPAPPSAPLPDK